MDHKPLSRGSLLGWLILQGGPCLAVACVEQVGGAAAGGDHTAGAPQEAAVTKRDLAVAQARKAFRTLGIDPTVLILKGVEPVTWPDSSLGCPEAGIQYLQVLTTGYRIELQGPQEEYFVNVAGDRAIVCSGATGGKLRLNRPLVPVRGIDLMTHRAQEMLAAVVHAPAEQIRIAGFEPQVWADTGLGCPSPAAPVPGRVTGFRIRLEYGNREYTFNTDLHRVIACPPIEAD